MTTKRQLRAMLDDAIDLVEHYRVAHDDACALIARMHAAAVGEIRGPERGVVEDIEDAVRTGAERYFDERLQDQTYRSAYARFTQLY